MPRGGQAGTASCRSHQYMVVRTLVALPFLKCNTRCSLLPAIPRRWQATGIIQAACWPYVRLSYSHMGSPACLACRESTYTANDGWPASPGSSWLPAAGGTSPGTSVGHTWAVTAEGWELWKWKPRRGVLQDDPYRQHPGQARVGGSRLAGGWALRAHARRVAEGVLWEA